MKTSKMRKVLALLLVVAMMLSTCLVASATTSDVTTGSANASGQFEGHLEKSAVAVQFPTNISDTTSYILDPELLITRSEKSKNSYSDCTFEGDTGIYFPTAAKQYSDKSAELQVTNKGGVNANVSLKAAFPANTGDVQVKTAASDVTLSDTTANIYMALEIVGAKTGGSDIASPVKAITKSDVTSEFKLGLEGSDDNFKIVYDTGTGKYKYEEKADVADTAWNSFKFRLSGAAGGDWSASGLAAPTVTLTWSYESAGADETMSDTIDLDPNAVSDAGPSIVGSTTITYSGSGSYTIQYSLGAGASAATRLSNVTYAAGSDRGDLGSAADTTVAGRVTVQASSMAYIKSNNGTITLHFDTGDAVELTVR